jgi:hypothetical protein
MRSLLDRQVSLLEYLTSRDAILGGRGDASLTQALPEVDRGLLRLQACFSHDKRMENIVAVFPRTFEILASDQDAVVSRFVAACPPVDTGRLENARQFHDFLRALWRREPAKLPYLPDVAACEFAFAHARVGISDHEFAGGKPGDMRRHPSAILLRCAYNVRPIFESATVEMALPRHDTLLAVAIPPGAKHPRVFELIPAVFDTLAALEDWTDRSALGGTRELDELIGELAAHGLLEVLR